MIAADNHPVNAVVLPEGGMEQAFSRTGIAHIKWIPALDDILFVEVTVDKSIDAFDTHLSRNIARLQGPNERVNENTVTYLNGNLGKILMGPVHRVPELKRCDRAPSLFFKNCA